MSKIRNIEFLRLIGCIVIICFHLFKNSRLHGLFADINLYDHLFKMTCNGQKAVDLFFILSGVFFVLTFKSSISLWTFLKKKLVRLYPVLIFCMLLYFVFSFTGLVKFTLYDNILNLLCLNGTGMVLEVKNVGQFWYVSSMLWVLTLLFYLLKNVDKKYVDLFVALSVFTVYTFLIQAKGGKINNHEQTFYYIFNVGMMRAIGGIGLGYFIGDWYKRNVDKIQNCIISLKSKILLTICEFVCLYFIINNLLLHKLCFKNHMIFIVAFVGIIVLFMFNKGFISKFFDKDIYVNLSKYTYSIYMTHIFIYEMFQNLIWKIHPGFVYSYPILNIFLVLSTAICMGIFTYHLVEEPCTKYFKQKANLVKIPVNTELRGGGVFEMFPLQRYRVHYV